MRFLPNQGNHTSGTAQIAGGQNAMPVRLRNENRQVGNDVVNGTVRKYEVVCRQLHRSGTWPGRQNLLNAPTLPLPSSPADKLHFPYVPVFPGFALLGELQ